MKREFFAEFDLVRELGSIGQEIRRLLKREKSSSKAELERIQSMREQRQEEVRRILSERIFNNRKIDAALRHTLLAQLLAVDVICEGKNTQCKDYVKGKDGLQRWYYGGDFKEPRGNFQEFLSERLSEIVHILGFEELQNTISQIIISPTLPDLSIFPHGSWAVRVPFTLRKPYISKDDKAFYILDNPVKKEWVFKVPYVAPSQWKGTLRATMVRQLVDWWQKQSNRNPEEFARNRLRLFLLFGDEKGEEPGSIKGLAKYLDDVGGAEAAKIFREKVHKLLRMSEDKPLPHFSGRLHFYPTFFDRIGMEVINPQDRRKGTGARGPIYFECVPAGTGGVFALLYVPLIQEDDEDYKDDMKSIARGIRAMLTTYGFGAKTSSGYGVANVDKSGIIVEPEGWKDEFIKGWDENE